MSTYVAFLRAINVAGHAVVRMTELQQAFSSAGCKHVSTYIQSGNVIFEAPDERAHATDSMTAVMNPLPDRESP